MTDIALLELEHDYPRVDLLDARLQSSADLPVIPQIGDFNPVHWFDLAQEQFTDGQVVGRFNDRGSSGVDLVNASGAPVYDQAANWIVLDGIDDALQSENLTSTGVSQPHTTIFVAEITTSDSDQIVLDADASVGASFRSTFDAFTGGGDSHGIWAGANLDGPAGLVQPMAVWILEYNGASSRIIRNGVVEAVGNAGTQGQRGLTVGARQNLAAGRFAGLHLRELAKLNGLLTAQQIDDLSTSLQNKWAETIPADISGDDFAGLWTGSGALVLETTPASTADGQLLTVSDGTPDNLIAIEIAGGVYRARIVTAGVEQASVAGGTVAAGVSARLALAFDATTAVLYRGGQLQGTDNALALPAVDRLTLDPQAAIAVANYYPARPDDADIAVRSTVGWTNDLVTVTTGPVVDDATIEARLATAPEFDVELGLWPWGTRTRSSVGDAELINIDNGLDWLYTRDLRGKPARLFTGLRGQPRAQYTQIGQMATDFLSSGQRGRIRVVFASLDRAFAERMQRRNYTAADTTNANLIGRPMPVTFGSPAQIEPLLSDAVALQYDYHDQPVAGQASAVAVRSNGFPATSGQWTDGGRGFAMNVTPQGLITADIGSLAGADTIEQIIPALIERTAFAGDTSALLADLAALAAAHPAELADYLPADERTADLLDRWLGDHLAAWYVDALGKLRITEITPPEARDPQGTPDLVVDQVQQGNTPRRRDDLMPGLTLTVRAGRRHRPIRQESADVNLTPAQRDEVAAEFTITERAAPGAVDPFYFWALAADPRPTSLTDTGAGIGAAALASRLAAFAGRRRAIWEYPALLPAGTQLRPNMWVRATFDGLGLAGGRDTTLIGYRQPARGSRFNLLLWG